MLQRRRVKIDTMDYINWWEMEKESGLEEITSKFNRLFNTENIPSIYHPILYKYARNSQLKNWNEDIFEYTNKKILSIQEVIGKDELIATLLKNFHFLISSYESLLTIEERILLMDRFRGSEELKAKSYSISICNDLLNSSFTNILKTFIKFQSIIEGKDLTQKNLTSQIELLKTREFDPIVGLADSDIRNAMSHGGVNVIGSNMFFHYRRGKEHLIKEMSVYQFKDNLFQIFDGISAVFLAFINYLCEENLSYDLFFKNEDVDEVTESFFERLCLSTLLISCNRIWKTEIFKDDGKKEQINIEFYNNELDNNSRLFFGIYTAERIYGIRNLHVNGSIMVNFSSPKTVNSFFIVENSEIKSLREATKSIEDVAYSIIKSGNVLLFQENTEDRNVFEDLFRYYPDVDDEDFYITEIEDISNENQKRLKAIIYLKKAKRKTHVKSVVKNVVNTMKKIENYGFSTHKVKYGKMDADILYFVIYKHEVRRQDNRSLLPKNSNFVVQVQYDVLSKFPINNNLLENYVKKRREGNVEYNWNPNF